MAGPALAGPLQAGADTSVPASVPAPVPASDAIQLAQGDCPSLSEAVARVRRQYKGRIVSAETVRRGKRETHVIKVLTDDGTVKTVNIPGCSLNSSRG